MNQVPYASYGNPDRNMNRTPRPAPRATQRRHADEDKAWSDLYRSIREPAVAAEVVEHLESDEQTLRQHTALYLRSRETLRRERARVARNQRIGQVVRAAFAALGSLFAAARRMARNGGDAALEVLAPERVEPVGAARVQKPRVEPAVKRARKLAKTKEFAPMPNEVAAPAAPVGAHTAQAGGPEAARHPGSAKVA